MKLKCRCLKEDAGTSGAVGNDKLFSSKKEVSTGIDFLR